MGKIILSCYYTARIFSIWFRALIAELFNNLISLFVIGLVYLVLWYFPQTVDLLLVLNQSDTFFAEVPFYFSLLTILALLLCSTPKYFIRSNHQKLILKKGFSFIPHFH